MAWVAPETLRNIAWAAAIESVTFFQNGVDEYARNAYREMAARFPHSAYAITQAYVAARNPNPYPNNGTPDQIASFWRKGRTRSGELRRLKYECGRTQEPVVCCLTRAGVEYIFSRWRSESRSQRSFYPSTTG